MSRLAPSRGLAWNLLPISPIWNFNSVLYLPFWGLANNLERDAPYL